MSTHDPSPRRDAKELEREFRRSATRTYVWSKLILPPTLIALLLLILWGAMKLAESFGRSG